MTSTTFPRGWRYRVFGIGSTIHDDNLTWEEKRDRIAVTLQRMRDFPRDDAPAGDVSGRGDELYEVWDELRDAEDPDHLNLCLSGLYDWADQHRVWIEPGF